jgi:hypothetical protein
MDDKMTNNTVHGDALTLALDRTSGSEFETFAKSLFSSLEGVNFAPTGGVHDGGADGIVSSIFEDGKPDTFYQFTIQENHRDKIRSTVKRLIEVGRTPKRLIFVTSRHIALPDKEEDDLDAELGIRIRIRAREYLIGHVNDSPQTQSAFKNNLSHKLDFLRQPGSAALISKKPHITDPSVYVFLQQESRNRTNKLGMIQDLTDSLIIWSLNETNPDTAIFLNENNIRDKILSVVPWSKQFLNTELPHRLSALQKKNNVAGRLIQFHKKNNGYCLPHVTRETIETENLADELLLLTVKEELTSFANKIIVGNEMSANQLTDITLETLQAFFEKQGLLLSYYIKHDDANYGSIENIMSDRIDEVLEQKNLPVSERIFARDHVHQLLNQSFYGNNVTIGEYLARLARTYCMMFSLQAEPRLAEYFQQMTADFRLLIGSDILIRAISERYLDDKEQTVKNLLMLCAASGSKLVLTEPVLREVYYHIRSTNWEFQNHYAEIENYLTRELIANSDRVLIRAYFYAKQRSQVKGWKSYISQFIEWDDLVQEQGINNLRTYLMSKFELEFLGDEELEACTSKTKVEALTKALLAQSSFGIADKKKEELAKNDALMVHAVYGLRKAQKETSRVTEFGYSTWWLTQELLVLKHTVSLVKENSSLYIMRPEFLLNFLSISPKVAEIRLGFKKIFPSTIGLQMGHRLPDYIFNEILDGVHNWSQLEAASVTAKVNTLSNKLKADHLKRYTITFPAAKDLFK